LKKVFIVEYKMSKISIVVCCSVAIGIFASAWTLGYIISTYVFGEEFDFWNLWCAVFGNIAISPVWLLYFISVYLWQRSTIQVSVESL
jgi:hypothetical protein